MEPNDQLTNTGEVKNHLEQSTTGTLSDIETEIVSEIETEYETEIVSEIEMDYETEIVTAIETEIETEIVTTDETEIVTTNETEIVTTDETEIVTTNETEIVTTDETEIVTTDETEIVTTDETEIVTTDETECVTEIETASATTIETECVTEIETASATTIETECVTEIETASATTIKTECVTEIKTASATKIEECVTAIKPNTEIKTENKSVKWMVGYFENENLYSVIPSNWLLNVSGIWYSKWPNSSIKSTIQARIESATDPAKTWKYYPVKVLKKYDSYHEAEEETFSCISVVEQDCLGRGKRKKKTTFRNFYLSGDSDSDNSYVSSKDDLEPKIHKKCGRKSLKDNIINTASSSNGFESHQESCSSQSSSSNLRKNGKTSLQDSKFNSSDFSSRKKRNKQIKEEEEYMSTVLQCFDRLETNLNELAKILIENHVAKKQMEAMIKLNEKKKEQLDKAKPAPPIIIKQEPMDTDELDTFEEIETNSVDSEFLSNFPMTELDDIINFELRIGNSPEVEEKFISYLTAIGGPDIKSYVKRILSKSFTNRLSTQCTWRGYHGNFELQKLNMIKTMCDVSKSLFGDSIETAFEVYVKEWFRRGKQRYHRQINTVRARNSAKF